MNTRRDDAFELESAVSPIQASEHLSLALPPDKRLDLGKRLQSLFGTDQQTDSLHDSTIPMQQNQLLDRFLDLFRAQNQGPTFSAWMQHYTGVDIDNADMVMAQIAEGINSIFSIVTRIRGGYSGSPMNIAQGVGSPILTSALI